MRVIAGKAKRLQLKTPTGMDTRPTTDRIKETLFNMIQDELYDICFLDLFSGSGGICTDSLPKQLKESFLPLLTSLIRMTKSTESSVSFHSPSTLTKQR